MNMQNTGAFIQASRKRLNISRQALGKSLSVTDQTVADWESGLACPGMEDLKNMALLFHCSITDMVNGTPDSGQSGNLPSEMPEDVTEPEDFSCPVNVALDYTDRRLFLLCCLVTIWNTRGDVFTEACRLNF